MDILKGTKVPYLQIIKLELTHNWPFLGLLDFEHLVSRTRYMRTTLIGAHYTHSGQLASRNYPNNPAIALNLGAKAP